uniref:GCK domain-containing protein n=1 Tax=Spongospora subterranea TaxID=70186 RepID=A0A0H5RB10_9EUKA|eukprot:CRZ05659.1 hypothetical protein [Spongospora subterranea]
MSRSWVRQLSTALNSRFAQRTRKTWAVPNIANTRRGFTSFSAGLGFISGATFTLATVQVPGESSNVEPSITDNISEEDTKKMLDMMIEDSKCPECARAALKGPCGMALMMLLMCYSKGEDKDNLERCALTFGPDLTQCMEAHRDYYGDPEAKVDTGDRSSESEEVINQRN